MKFKKRIENFIVDDMSQKQIKYLQAVTPEMAKGTCAEIYQQVRRDFQLVPPITLFSSVTDLLAGIWSITRESQLVSGHVSRSDKEVISAMVSHMNTCAYCVDAHVGMLHGTSEHAVADSILANETDDIVNQNTKSLIRWTLANRSANNHLLQSPPFRLVEMPEIIGTALSYHFINRMVALFLVDSPLPVNTTKPFLRKIATRIFGATAGKSIATKQVKAGESLVFLPENELPQEFSWAVSNVNIANAYAGFSSIMEIAGEKVVPREVREHLINYLNQWNGEEMPLGHQWLEEAIKELDKSHEHCARLVFLTALSPYQISEKVISDFRDQYPTNEELLSATCWASFAATKRISQWLKPVIKI